MIVCVYVYIYIYTYIYIHIHIHIHAYMHTNWLYIFIYIHAHIYIYIHHYTLWYKRVYIHNIDTYAHNVYPKSATTRALTKLFAWGEHLVFIYILEYAYICIHIYIYIYIYVFWGRGWRRWHPGQWCTATLKHVTAAQQGGKGPYKSPGSSTYSAQHHVQASRKAENLARAAARWQKPQETTTPIGLAWATQCRRSISHAGIRGYGLPSQIPPRGRSQLSTRPWWWNKTAPRL